MPRNIPPPPPPFSKADLAHIAKITKERNEIRAFEIAESKSLKNRLLFIKDAFLAITGVVLFSWLITMSMEKQADDLSTWAKGFDYRHCWGKFDTPACHERKKAGNKAAYEKYIKENK